MSSFTASLSWLKASWFDTRQKDFFVSFKTILCNNVVPSLNKNKYYLFLCRQYYDSCDLDNAAERITWNSKVFLFSTVL